MRQAQQKEHGMRKSTERAIKLMKESLSLIEDSEIDGLTETAKNRHYEIIDSFKSNIEKIEKIANR